MSSDTKNEQAPAAITLIEKQTLTAISDKHEAACGFIRAMKAVEETRAGIIRAVNLARKLEHVYSELLDLEQKLSDIRVALSQKENGLVEAP